MIGRLASVLCLAAAVLAGCSSDADRGSSTTVGGSPDGSFCSLLLAFRAANEAIAGEATSGDVARATAAMDRLVGQVELLQDKAPADIRGDVDTVTGYVIGLRDLLGRNGYDLDAIQADPDATAEFVALSSDEVNGSLEQLRAYADTDCAGG